MRRGLVAAFRSSRCAGHRFSCPAVYQSRYGKGLPLLGPLAFFLGGPVGCAFLLKFLRRKG